MKSITNGFESHGRNAEAAGCNLFSTDELLDGLLVAVKDGCRGVAEVIVDGLSQYHYPFDSYMASAGRCNRQLQKSLRSCANVVEDFHTTNEGPRMVTIVNGRQIACPSFSENVD